MLATAIRPPDHARLLAAIDGHPEPPSERALNSLVRSWLFHQPFHNLDLLAAAAQGGASLDLPQAIDRCAASLGGPCHVQAAGFHRLVSSLGYDAWFCGATIGHPDDHLVVGVRIANETFVCDVGNGQPYLAAFPTRIEHEVQHLGWRIQTRPTSGGLELWRTSPDVPDWRRVYAVDPTPRAWTDFANTIERHHREPGFGPFLTGLRAVRISATRMTTVRDAVCTDYRVGAWSRRDLDEDALVRALRYDLSLDALPVDDAIRSWATARARTA